MTQEPKIDYQAVLRDLQARRQAVAEARDREIAELDGAIAVARKLARNGTPTETTGAVTAVQPGSYAEMTLAQAIHDFLKTAGEPKSAAAIVRAVENGGYVSKSKKFYNTVYNRLMREAEHGRLYRKNGRWGLPSWKTASGLP